MPGASRAWEVPRGSESQRTPAHAIRITAVPFNLGGELLQWWGDTLWLGSPPSALAGDQCDSETPAQGGRRSLWLQRPSGRVLRPFGS